jgi:hypothetical protein
MDEVDTCMDLNLRMQSILVKQHVLEALNIHEATNNYEDNSSDGSDDEEDDEEESREDNNSEEVYF